MKVVEGIVKTRDGLNLKTKTWWPEGVPKAICIVVHGIGDHISRYSHLSQILTTHDIIVAGYDQRGHGISEGLRAYVHRWSDLIDDLRIFVQHTSVHGKDLPLFFFGHSLGGLVLTSFVLEDQPQVNGVILSSPALKVSEDLSPLLQKMAPILSRIAPRLKTVALDPSLISRDPDIVHAYKKDPLVYHGGVRSRTGGEVLNATRRVQKKFNQFKFPVLILHGTADQLTDPSGSQKFFEEITSDDKTIQLFDGWYHELINEPQGDQVIQLICRWISDHRRKLPG